MPSSSQKSNSFSGKLLTQQGLEDALPFIRMQPIIDSVAAFTVAVNHQGTLVRQNMASANNITVPTDVNSSIQVGFQVSIANAGAGQVTFVPQSGVTINSAGGALKLRVQYSVGTLIKVGSNTWLLTGDITT